MTRIYFFIFFVGFYSLTIVKGQKKITASEIIELNATRDNNLNDFSGSYSAMNIKDGRFWDNVYPKITGIPDSLNGVKVYFDNMSNIQALHQAYKAGIVKTETYNGYKKAWNSDTTFCTSDYVNTFIVIATGTSNSGKRYYLFDSNNNHDLSDEKLFETSYSTLRNGNNNIKHQPHKVIYEKYMGKKIQQDSTWISFFEDEKYMWLNFCDKATTTFELDSIRFTIDVIPSSSRSSRYSLGVKFNINQGGIENKMYYNLDHLVINNSAYQITCSNDGLKVYLTKKIDDFQKEESSQVGMYPYKFKAKTLNGDTINFPEDFKGKYVLLDFWYLTCPPCMREIKDYYIDIYNNYGGEKFEIIGVANNKQQDLENKIDQLGIKWIIISDEEHRTIINKYGVYFYPTIYLISPDGVILGKNEDLRDGKFVLLFNENIESKNNAR